MICAGEASGDLHASNLITELRKFMPGAEIYGFGGPKMKAAGTRLYYDLTEIAVVGFVEVLKRIGTFRKLFNLFLKEAEKTKPDGVILVDYPGFNLMLAPKLKALGIKIFYYISPQLWAWHKERIEIVRKYVDKMIVVFKFEEEFYAKEGIKADFVGHPLLDIVKPSKPKEETLSNLRFSAAQKIVALLPGSREEEVKRLLPVMLEASRMIKEKAETVQFVILKSPILEQKVFDAILKKAGMPAVILEDQAYDGLNIADFCIVASGTATLETAIMEKPMVVIYKTSCLTYIIARRLVTIPDIALVNVVAGSRIVPEFVQQDASANNIAQAALGILSNSNEKARMIEKLQKLKTTLLPKGAAQKAASLIHNYLNSST